MSVKDDLLTINFGISYPEGERKLELGTRHGILSV
jgi:hypothetical protein